jgi:putative acetyltransferase
MPESPEPSPRTYIIRSERRSDIFPIDGVIFEAFSQQDEVKLVRELRDGGFNLLSLVAHTGVLVIGHIIGHILFTRLLIAGEQRSWNAVALAPLAVWPLFQRAGVGSALVREGLKRLKESGETIVVVLGHEHYYTRFGFSPQLAEPLLAPFNGPHWMALELQPGALQDVRGKVKYAPPFGIPDL